MPDGEAEKDARTVFVRNVAFSVDNAGLEQVFADIGPVRQCFLVTQKGTEGTKHRGIAFVQFAIPEDAQRAVEELNGKEVAGRRLKIELAHKRAPLQERKQRKRAAEDAADSDEDATHEQQQQQPAAAAKAGKANTPAVEPSAKRQKQQQQPQDGAAAAAAASAASAGQHSGKDKHKWVRTVALGGLSQEFKAHALQLAAAAGGFQEVLDPPPADVAGKAHLAQDGCSGDVVFLVYATVKEASQAVSQLHGKAITPAHIAAAEAAAAVAAEAAAAAAAGGKASKKGKAKQAAKQAAKQLKQQQAAAASAAAAAAGSEGGIVLWARHVSGEGALVKKWRLILRNLPFQATEAEVRKLLAPSGVFTWQVQLPTRADGRSSGFAFASFLSYHEAEKALAAANGQLLRKRPVAVDWALGKGQYQQLQQQQGAAGAAAAAAAADEAQNGLQEDDAGDDDDELSSGAEDEDEEGSEDFDQDGSSSDVEEEEEEDSEVEEGLSSDEEDDEGSEAGSDDEEEGSDGEQGSEDQGFDQDRAVMQSALDAIIAKEQQPQEQPQQKQQKQQPAGGSDAAAAAASAAVKSAAVACTVFVRGLPLDVTSQELQARFDRFGQVKACRVVMDKATGKPKGTAFIEFKAPAGAAAAAEACARARAGKGPDVTVKGVKLNVDLALTQGDARRLGQEQGGVPGAGQTAGQSNKGGKFDRRNLYLAKEGFIEEGSAQWEAMSENDRRKRKRAAEEKNQKLKSPNFAVSTTRLAVRNIPASWDEAKLKAAFIAGVKARATKEKPVVKQAKILRDPERPDAAGHPGGKSRGFGFVEFGDPSHALAALRQLNNNPTAFGSRDRRPIVEFAVDNVKVLRARDDKLAKQKARQQQKKQEQQQPAADAAGGDEAAAAAAAEKQDSAAAGAKAKASKVSSSSGKDEQQQEQQQQLSKRQLKRQKEKQRKLAKMQQANGAQPAVAGKQQQQQQQKGRPAPTGAAQQQQPGPQQQQQQQQQQQNGKKASKREAATKAAAASAAAKAAQLAAKSARQQQQLQREDAARGRKRQADAELDRLAAEGINDAGAAGKSKAKQQQQQQQQQGGGKKRHKPGRAAEERLEALVQDYKSKLFGLGGGAGGKGQKQQQQQQRDSLKRWFD